MENIEALVTILFSIFNGVVITHGIIYTRQFKKFTKKINTIVASQNKNLNNIDKKVDDTKSIIEDKVLNDIPLKLKSTFYSKASKLDINDPIDKCIIFYLQKQVHDLIERYQDIKNFGPDKLREQSFQDLILGDIVADLDYYGVIVPKDVSDEIKEINKKNLEFFINYTSLEAGSDEDIIEAVKSYIIQMYAQNLSGLLRVVNKNKSRLRLKNSGANSSNTIEDLKSSISGDIDNNISIIREAMKKAKDKDDNSTLNNLLLLSGQFERLRNQANTSVISNTEGDQQFSKLTNSLIEHLDELK